MIFCLLCCKNPSSAKDFTTFLLEIWNLCPHIHFQKFLMSLSNAPYKLFGEKTCIGLQDQMLIWSYRWNEFPTIVELVFFLPLPPILRLWKTMWSTWDSLSDLVVTGFDAIISPIFLPGVDAVLIVCSGYVFFLIGNASLWYFSDFVIWTHPESSNSEIYDFTFKLYPDSQINSRSFAQFF